MRAVSFEPAVGAGVPPALYGRDGRTYSPLTIHSSQLKAHSPIISNNLSAFTDVARPGRRR